MCAKGAVCVEVRCVRCVRQMDHNEAGQHLVNHHWWNFHLIELFIYLGNALILSALRHPFILAM
eukprot:SAG11_NODE_39438_length_232_cov_5.127820_1_plen_63_part_10